ncbi:hypothetical protein [Streptomyces aurantiacus]|uniref:hypothetical protein n=1 Tax=Streptomyces aurantiacus TaxID=47760 RepID=UPI0006E30A0A|nr:hypothetical protein [Streptomyces aurantiacus]
MDKIPVVGTVVRDARHGRVGRVMGHEGPYIQLRPLAGGREWDAAPERIRVLTSDELLSVLLADANARRGQFG